MLIRLGHKFKRPDLIARGEKGNWFSAIMLDPNKPSPTICKNIGTGGVWHWRKRWLSIEEILVLTGFPANYKLHGSFGKRWARVGNSVAPPMTREIVKQSLR